VLEMKIFGEKKYTPNRDPLQPLLFMAIAKTESNLRSAQLAQVYLPGDAPLCTAAKARFASGPVSRKMGKE